MEYSEKSDFEEKSQVLASMTARLAKYGLTDSISNAKTLEIGGSGGVLGGLLSNQVGRIIVTDVVDTQLQYKGEFPKLLNEKFIRNGYDFSFGKIEFQVADAMDLPYKDNSFDLVVSLNTFEHIPNPVLALEEALRVTKTGGLIYLTFDPVWTADTGSHFAQYVKEPWAHLLFDDVEFSKVMIEAGAPDYLINEYRVAMNRQPASVYRDIFPKVLESHNVKSFKTETWRGCVDKNHENHPNRLTAAQKLGCSHEDLLIRGFCYVIQK